MKMPAETLKELRRVLSKLGVASRKQSEEIIKNGRISVNGKVVINPRTPIYMSDTILLDRKPIVKKEIKLYAFNKPKNVITTMSDERGRTCVADFMPKDQYLFPVGRLDKASRGLILLTNDNDFANKIMSPANKLKKIYRVQVKGRFVDKHIAEMKRGIFIDRIRYTAEIIKIIKINKSSTWLEIVLVEGKNRQIRRMLETLGYEILELVRIQIGRLKLEKLKLQPGEFVEVKKEWVA